MPFVLHKMTVDHLAGAHALSMAVRWPHRLDDWRFVLDVGQGFVALDGDQVAGTAMSWLYGDTVARIGMIIVDPNRQRSGIGRELMSYVLDQCSGRCMVLNATAEGRALYDRLGFRPSGRIVQHQGIVSQALHAALPPGHRLREATAADIDVLTRLDAMAGGVERPRVVASLLTLGHTVMLEHDGEAVGFAVVRSFGRGALIGPVVAQSRSAAAAMIDALLRRHHGTFVRIDIVEDGVLSASLDAAGLVRVDDVQRMFLGTLPGSAPDMQVFALVNQALG